MNIEMILNGSVGDITNVEQIEAVEKLKEIKVFDLDDNQRTNLVDFICNKLTTELSVDYLFHVLDTEITYPINDDKVRLLFSDERMKNLNTIMMEQLYSDVEEELSE